jgi:plastocyanin
MDLMEIVRRKEQTMKRFTSVILYGIIAALGLVGAIGCTSSVSGPSTSNPFYSIDISVAPATLQNGNTALVTCYVNDSRGNRFRGGHLWFSTLGPGSSITGFAQSSDTSVNGMDRHVTYYPATVQSDSDYIFVEYKDSLDSYVLSRDSVRVTITHSIVTVSVAMQNNLFDPGTITVAPGTNVVWNNLDNTVHTVTSGVNGVPDGLFNSGDIAASGNWQKVFSNTGTFPYYCTHHLPTMTGVVIVQ